MLLFVGKWWYDDVIEFNLGVGEDMYSWVECCVWFWGIELCVDFCDRVRVIGL